MIVYNKEPPAVLWDTLKSLAGEIPIYREIMDEDEDSVPQSYVLIRTDVTNVTGRFGDGLPQTRRSACDIVVVTKGRAGNSTDLHSRNVAKVRRVIEKEGLPHSGYNLGYDTAIKSTEYAFSATIYYTPRSFTATDAQYPYRYPWQY